MRLELSELVISLLKLHNRFFAICSGECCACNGKRTLENVVPQALFMFCVWDEGITICSRCLLKLCDGT